MTRESLYISKQNRKTINSFCKKETNLIIASSVLEEGIDIPNCTLVVKFDKPMNYRSYIQSKGRARHKESFYYVQVKDEELRKFCESYETYREVEQILNKVSCGTQLRAVCINEQTMCISNEVFKYIQAF